MTHLQMATRTILAAPIAGGLCALGFLVVAFSSAALEGAEGADGFGPAFLLVIWVAYAGPIGLVAGVVLGAVPAVVSVLSWPVLDRRLGTERAIEATVLVVGGLSLPELLVVAWAFESGPVAMIGWAAGGAVVCALTLRLMLRRGWRVAERRARVATTY